MRQALDRHMRLLEAKAPSGVERPQGLTGDTSITFMFDEMSNASHRPEREQAQLRSAFLDLPTADEERRIREMVAACTASDDAGEQPSNGTGSRRGSP